MPRFQTKPVELEAVQLRCSYTFGRSKGRAGDWLVTHADGRQEIVGAGDFAGRYVPVDGNGTPPAAKPTRAIARRTPATPTKKPRGKSTRWLSKEVWAAARKDYEAGVSSKEIAARLGVDPSAVYWQSKHHGWKKPAAAAAKPQPKGEKLRGRVRCSSCQSMTEYDPCEHCGAAVAFKG